MASKKINKRRNSLQPLKSIRHSELTHTLGDVITQHQHPQHNTQIHSKLH